MNSTWGCSAPVYYKNLGLSDRWECTPSRMIYKNEVLSRATEVRPAPQSGAVGCSLRTHGHPQPSHNSNTPPDGTRRTDPTPQPPALAWKQNVSCAQAQMSSCSAAHRIQEFD